MNNLKDKITNVVAIILVVLGALNTYLQANAGKAIDWIQLMLFLGGAIIAYYTGKNSDGTTKGASQLSTAVKTIALLIGLTFMCNVSQAQTFKGFFKPKSAIEMPKSLKSTYGDVSVTPQYVWKFRPAVFITADAVKVSGGIAITQPLSSLGTGVSLSKFINNNGIPYEQFGVSGLVMTNINLNGTALTTIGGGLIIGAFNGIVNVGGAYIGKQVYVLLGTKINL